MLYDSTRLCYCFADTVGYLKYRLLNCLLACIFFPPDHLQNSIPLGFCFVFPLNLKLLLFR